MTSIVIERCSDHVNKRNTYDETIVSYIFILLHFSSNGAEGVVVVEFNTAKANKLVSAAQALHQEHRSESSVVEQ